MPNPEFPFNPDVALDQSAPPVSISAAASPCSKSLATDVEIMQVALDSMAHGLCLFDPDGRLKLYNKRFLEMYGLKAEDIKLGMEFLDLMWHRKNCGTFTGDPEELAAEIREGLALGTSIDRTAETADGRFIIVTNSATAEGGWVATHRDVSLRVRAERERDQSKSFLDTVISQVPAVVIVKNARTFQYVLINEKAEHYIGLQSDEVIGKTPHELFPPERADKIVNMDRLFVAGQLKYDYHGAPLHKYDQQREIVITKRQIIRDAKGQPEYLISIIEDVTERTRAAEHMAHMARHDALTGLGNRVLFAEKIDDALHSAGQNAVFNVLLLDLDHFKNINDSLGHPVGDILLKTTANRIKGLLTDQEVVVRLSGDEFAIVQKTDRDQREAAIDLANRIHNAILEPIEVDGQTLIIGTSIGIALAPDHGLDVDELVKCADLALYRAKFAGRNQHCFFERRMEKEVQDRRALELDLRQGLAENQFEVWYQPVVNSLTREICGAEALIRWNSPTRGLVPPDAFIAVAEETGLIVPLGEWVMRRACTDAAAWPKNVKVAVNLSAALFSKCDLIGLVSEALVESELAPERLELEITESVLLQKNEDNIALLHAMKNMGVNIVLDDFGTGYSSLGYLKMFPFDTIKIDKSFVNELSTRMDCAAIVCAIAGLGRSLNITTTAEGVETNEQFTLLRAVGCTQVQGYLFGHPVPVAELVFNAPGSINSTAGGAWSKSPAPPMDCSEPPEMDLPRQIA